MQRDWDRTLICSGTAARYTCSGCASTFHCIPVCGDKVVKQVRKRRDTENRGETQLAGHHTLLDLGIRRSTSAPWLTSGK